MASITIRKSIPDFEREDVQSYDMVLEVMDAQDMPKEIFVFESGIAPARTPEEPASDYFVFIASPVDLEEIPVNTPESNGKNPFYRVEKITLRFRCMLDLEEAWEYIKQDIQGLITALNLGIEGGSSEDVTFR